ncbi:hypothetical protein AALP_AA5G116600 [Arabis alpina]|uniref:Uncharacterized protein n=1 Tax=Arabis alpina TaxID=50452 RepID=A0A087GWH1_ARAAL|nr:hypothetical protein AALP_AA5G116600 [Arabis alpina]
MINNSEMEDPANKLKDLKRLKLENQKLKQKTLTLTKRNQTSIDSIKSNAELYLEKLQAENQKLTEEVLRLTKKNNTRLAFQSELYKKAIEAKMSNEARKKSTKPN